MDIKEFGNEMAGYLRTRLGEDYEVELKDISKNNGVNYLGVLIRKGGENIAPNIYLESFYEEYQKGTEIEELAEEILDIYKEHSPNGKIDPGFYRDFATLADKLSFKLVNRKRNQEYLKDIPYKTFEDLALVPICIVNEKSIGEGNIVITKDHLKLWEISKSELWENVLESARKVNKPVVRNMADVIGNMGLWGLSEMQLSVISNKRTIYGASVMLQDGVLREVSQSVNDDLYIIPSSVHEILAVPAALCDNNPAVLKMMIKDVNSNVLSKEDVLSDNVYYYDASLDKLFINND